MTGERGGAPPTRTVFIGSGHFGREGLWALADRPEVELVGVVTAPPRPSGRGQRPTATVIGDAARTLGVQAILTPERLRAPESVAGVLALEPDLLVLADYGQIVPPALLAIRHGALNLHPSLLPRHRGATPIPATILAGDEATGVTLMRMDAGLDTGPIVAQVRVLLDGTETTPWLELTLALVAADLLASSVGPWLHDELEPRPQGEVGATLTRPLRRDDGRLDPARPAAELERRVRAFQPWPGSFIDTVVGRIVVWAASVGDDGPGAGRFDEVGLGTPDGRLVLDEVQPASGKRMPWADFVRGRPAIVGSAVSPGP